MSKLSLSLLNGVFSFVPTYDMFGLCIFLASVCFLTLLVWSLEYFESYGSFELLFCVISNN